MNLGKAWMGGSAGLGWQHAKCIKIGPADSE